MSEKHELLSNVGSWAKEFNSIAVCGKCDSGCGQDATTWYGNTSVATCGRVSCVSIQDDEYEALCRAIDLEAAKMMTINYDSMLNLKGIWIFFLF